MTINLETIDALRERTQVSYSKAKEALEASNGDLVEAIIYLEEKGYTSTKNPKEKKGEFKKNTKSFFKKMNSINFDLLKKGKTTLRLPLPIFLLTLLFAFPIVVIGLFIAVALGYKIEFTKDGKKIKEINDSLDNISNTMQSTFKKED
jgi:hypothetical protein